MFMGSYFISPCIMSHQPGVFYSDSFSVLLYSSTMMDVTIDWECSDISSVVINWVLVNKTITAMFFWTSKINWFKVSHNRSQCTTNVRWRLMLHFVKLYFCIFIVVTVGDIKLNINFIKIVKVVFDNITIIVFFTSLFIWF